MIVALGSNVAAPEEAVRTGWAACVEALQLHGATLSALHVTEPSDGASGGAFINAVGVGATSHSPAETLAILQRIESRFGRDRGQEGHHGARPLDLDLVDHGGTVSDAMVMCLPHPRAARRRFVMQPLTELLPRWRHPRSKKTALELFLALAWVSMAACSHPPPPASPWTPVTAATAPAPLAMRVATVDNSQLLNDFFDALSAYEGGKFCAEAMLTSASRLPDDALSGDRGSRLLAIAAVYRIVETRALGEHFPAIKTLVDRLHRLAPKSPETRFALAYLRWILVHAGDGEVRAGELDRAVIVDLAANLKALVKQHPEFDGPGRFDRAQIRRAHLAVQGLLNGKTATLPAAITSDQGPA